jgi:glyoxylase-like metal-dependent hydrolase (beta-lactamase superfamily II)
MPPPIQVIDTKMHGLPGITGTFLVTDEQTALVETGPKSAVENVLAGLRNAAIETLDWIIVTHIHLDHAGAAGTLARHFPEARVAVHEVGVRHLVDPSKLWSSASRIYGDDMERLWGGIDPLPEARIVSLADGDKIELGSTTLQAVDTPGHAGHHHAYFEVSSGVAFVGDALGVRLPDVGVMRPATPPPEFDLELAVSSIGRIKELDPTEIYLTHYSSPAGGTNPASPQVVCDEAIEALRTWGAWVEETRTKTTDLDEVSRLIAERSRISMGQQVTEDAIERMDQTTSYWMNTSGYMRYFDKKSK